MKAKYLLLVFILSALLACHKGRVSPPGSSENPPSFVTLKLKDISIDNLQSPYYHFDYRDDKHLSSLNFRNGLIFDITYTEDNLTLMKNNTPGTTKDGISYDYTGDRPTAVNVTSDAGLLYRRAFLTYYPSGQLQNLEWEVKLDNQSFTREQSFAFTYYADGNVKEIMHHYFASGPLPETTFTDRYENYDDKLNVDGFALVHTSLFNHPILMPGIALQINNAGRLVRTGGAAVNFEANYTYTYDASRRPITKTADYVNTSGPDIGQHSESKTTYSYYN